MVCGVVLLYLVSPHPHPRTFTSIYRAYPRVVPVLVIPPSSTTARLVPLMHVRPPPGTSNESSFYSSMSTDYHSMSRPSSEAQYRVIMSGTRSG